MRTAIRKRAMEHHDIPGDQPPALTDILSQVVQALVDQGHEVPEITQAMRYVADMTDLIDRVYGDKM
ncbi:MAG: hypothetical protein B7Z60_07135 [Ferrovum sp. 37-45-19]|nr:hypothetical protein [Acidocella sp.]OYV39121.1 MAG: hypothetical protein B7Z83_02895 [Thiomonas sp. 20-64-5]OYV79248.1 MAG: hypothetical protein B7Z65_07050 [Ferrovum sp. 21-44-67]OYV93853.1 MAG: hypothetical protein B7Z60_07135 [Ferrovum sp. 37-45-19]OZB32152.1 MAG: hypothetical protein B7X47_07290 [Ferrovum sp. 34-44-207]HQT82018.1 hypothetical protein [Ferrovaceae bacterium]